MLARREWLQNEGGSKRRPYNIMAAVKGRKSRHTDCTNHREVAVPGLATFNCRSNSRVTVTVCRGGDSPRPLLTRLPKVTERGWLPVSGCVKAVKKYEPTLKELCEKVLSFKIAYDDVAEQIEDLAYFECSNGDTQYAVSELERLTNFFEGFQNKNEEISSDLAEVCLLIGQICQYSAIFDKSIDWINKSIVVDDQNPVAYHSLALSYQSIGDTKAASRSLEQEIIVAPGNYYTYLLLADIYEKNKEHCEFEGVLKRLLERDHENIQGLHKLICFYECSSSGLDVEFLRRRLLSRTLNLNRIEALIRAYHLCCQSSYREAIEFLDSFSSAAPDVSIVHLANAHIYGLMGQFSRKRFELSLFKKKNQGREEMMGMKLNEFASIFGSEAAQNIRQRLSVVHPVSL